MAVPTVFMGSDTFSVPVLKALFERGRRLERPVEVVGVVTQPDRAAGRGRRSMANPVKELALEFGVRVLQPERLRAPDAVERIACLGPQLIVVASYGQIIPQALLDVPLHQCLNLHPSLLPLYRGPSPVVGPLLAGDAVTGSSLMLMTAEMDAGPLIAQEQIPIYANESAGELELRLARVSAALLIDHVTGWVEGRLATKEQDDSLATYTAKLRKEDGLIDWALPADTIVRSIRAFNPWPMASTFWGDRRLRLLRAHAQSGRGGAGLVMPESGHRFQIGTGAGLVKVEEVQLAGGKTLTVGEFLRGHPHIMGAQLRSEPPWSSE